MTHGEIFSLTHALMCGILCCGGCSMALVAPIIINIWVNWCWRVFSHYNAMLEGTSQERGFILPGSNPIPYVPKSKGILRELLWFDTFPCLGGNYPNWRYIPHPYISPLEHRGITQVDLLDPRHWAYQWLIRFIHANYIHVLAHEIHSRVYIGGQKG